MRFLLTIICFCSFFAITQATENSAELITEKTVITIDGSVLVKEYYAEIKINDRSGDRFTQVIIPYSSMVKVSKLEAFIRDSRGNIIRKLKKDDIIERSNIAGFSLYEDDFVKEFSLKHNSYPYTIVYSYQSKAKEFFQVCNWIPVLDLEVPTHKAELKIITAKDKAIKFTEQHINSLTIDTTENNINYSWAASYDGKVKDEVFSPPLGNYFPRVLAVPTEFRFDLKGTFSSWQAYGNWQANIIEKLDELTNSEKSRIDGLVKGLTDKREIIKTLYHYLQDETRYINVTIETGGLKPYNAAYVCNNRYGDCKALTNYFKSLLKYVGIDAYYTKIYAGGKIRKLDKGFPSQQFNHVILLVPMENDTIWLDCTSKMAFNYLGTFDQNRDVFVINKNSSFLTRSPMLEKKDVAESRNISVRFNDDGTSTQYFDNTLRGEMYETISGIDRNYNNADKRNILKHYFTQEGHELINYGINKYHRDSALINIHLESRSQSIFRHYGNDLLIKNIPFALPGFEKPQDRNLPVQIDYPIYQTDTIDYQIPKGYKVTDIARGNAVSSEYGSYKVELKQQEKTVQVIKHIYIKEGRYPFSDYPSFYEFISAVNENESNTFIYLNPII